MAEFQNIKSPFRVYNASAGSGKTFALTVAFLQKILHTKADDGYKKLLAITFTNKAVAEMKNRILGTLESFAKGDFRGGTKDLAKQVLQGSTMTQAQLQAKSQAVLIHLLHHYAQFHVETIDRFNHRLLKTFSKDLKLSSNFEVSLETGLLLAEAVDALIDQAGRAPQITELLVSFALNKTEESRSWDIAFDLNKTAKMIIQENDAPHLAKLKDIPLENFIAFTDQLKHEKQQCDHAMQQIAGEIMALCDQNGILIEHLTYGSFIKIMQEVLDPKNAPNFERKWLATILNQDDPFDPPHRLYKTTAPKDIKAAVDQHHDTIVAALVEIHKWHIKSIHLKNTLAELIPLTVVEAIEKEFERIKKENNTLVISDFNKLLSEEIQNQPAPFIYERLGERFTHYFIDEFQDTSALQWHNLLPLVENNLAQADPTNPKHSLMIVGDPKQSIYRWRGGHPEQFIDLALGKSPELTPPEVVHLETNYRSHTDIVTFNNELYTFAADQLTNPEHKDLYYKGNKQNSHHKKTGFVSIEFLDKNDPRSGQGQDHHMGDKADPGIDQSPQAVQARIPGQNLGKKPKDELYHQTIEGIVRAQLDRGRGPGDLCILTRDNKTCSKIGAYLSERGYPIVSEEALLIQNNPIVLALIDLGYLSANPYQKRPRARLGNLMYNTFPREDSKMSFLKRITADDLGEFHALLSELGIGFKLSQMAAMGLYDRFAYALNQFGWGQSDNAYITQFMDWVFQYAKKPQATIWQLLTQWEQDKDSLSLSSGAGQEAIQIMTIHKAKGLEFPVVILPYAHETFNPTKVGYVWYPYPEAGFDHLPVRYSTNIAQYSDQGKAIDTRLRQTAFFDTLNLYYVGTTRPTEELYILCDKLGEEAKSKSFNWLLKEFLGSKGLWQEDKSSYFFGAMPKIETELKPLPHALCAPLNIVTPEQHPIAMVPERRASSYWFDAGIGFGSLFHEIMALVISAEDSEQAIAQIGLKYRLDDDQTKKARTLLQQTVQHPDLAFLFNSDHQVFVERSIITPTGVMRPDRINMIAANKAIVLDYKTGLPKVQDKDQILGYGAGLKAMGIEVEAHLIVYLREDPIVVNKI